MGLFPLFPDPAICFLLHLSLGHLTELFRLATASESSPGSTVHPHPPLCEDQAESWDKSGLRPLWTTASGSCPLGMAVVLNRHQEGYPCRGGSQPQRAVHSHCAGPALLLGSVLINHPTAEQGGTSLEILSRINVPTQDRTHVREDLDVQMARTREWRQGTWVWSRGGINQIKMI